MSKDRVGLTTYLDRRIRQARESVMKRGSDNAIECIAMKELDDKKNDVARMVVRKLRPVERYTARATSPVFIPKKMAPKKRAVWTKSLWKNPVAAKSNE